MYTHTQTRLSLSLSLHAYTRPMHAVRIHVIGTPGPRNSRAPSAPGMFTC